MTDRTTDDSAAPQGDFYVGYLPVPKRYRRFLQLAIPTTLLVMLASAAALALRQPAWGDGVWNTAAPRTFTGVMHAEPYAMIETEDADAAYLIVEPGKIGAQHAAARYDGKHVRVIAYELIRDGRRVLELDRSAPEPISPIDLPTPRRSRVEFDGAAVTLDGEILDAKCYIGAMKPGYGRGHKACAITCVSGGIPPAIVTADERGRPVYTLLVDQTGAAFAPHDLERLLPLIGEPVSVTGLPGHAAGWRLLAINPDRDITPR